MSLRLRPRPWSSGLIIALFAVVLHPGCAMFRIGVPDWASADAHAPGDGGEGSSWIWRAKGDQWLKFFYESVVDGSHRDLGRAEQELDLLKQSAVSILGELQALKKEGARYVVVPDQNGRVAVGILRPDEGLAAGAGRALLDKLNMGDQRHAALLEAALGQIGAVASRIERVGAQIRYRQYGAVATLEALAGGKPTGFGLPDGATPERLREVMQVLLAALERDLEVLRALEIGALGISLATRGASFENPYAGANVAASVIAALADARGRDAARRPYVDYPPPEAVLRAAVEESAALAAAIAKSSGYAEWRDGSHAQRKLAEFGSEVATGLKAFSAMSSIFLGYDVWAIPERSQGGIDFVDAATRLAERAPPRSQVRAVFEGGVRLTKARPDGAFQLVESPVEADRLQRELGSLAR